MAIANPRPWRAAKVALLTAALLLCAAAVGATARARVDCSGGPLRAQVERASTIFVGRLEGPATALDGLPADRRGVSGALVSFLVTRALRGALVRGDRVTVEWEGYSEPVAGPIIGGCRVPGLEAGASYPQTYLVLAEGTLPSLRVPNRTASTRVGPSNRRLVRRVAALARRAR